MTSKADDDLLTKATENAFSVLCGSDLFSIPSTWDIKMRGKSIRFSEIHDLLVGNNISIRKCNEYYGLDRSIVTDANIIYLIVEYNGKVMNKPLFLGEIKKQGTNDKRVLDGKDKQAIGNAAPDRVAKNYCIVKDLCALCDNDFFPYVVFLHGCDFGDEISETTESKLTPFFGTLNEYHTMFEKDIPGAWRGGTCFHQKDDFTIEQLSDIILKVCREGISFYREKYMAG